MKVIKVYNPKKNRIESYYLVARNRDNNFQLVAIPWARVDYRIYNTPQDAYNNLESIVSKRGWKVSWSNLSYKEIQERGLRRAAQIIDGL